MMSSASSKLMSDQEGNSQSQHALANDFVLFLASSSLIIAVLLACDVNQLHSLLPSLVCMLKSVC